VRTGAGGASWGLLCRAALVVTVAVTFGLSATASADPVARAADDYCIPSPAADTVARIAQACDSQATQKQNAANQTKTANKIADFLDKYGDAAIGTGAVVAGYGLATGPGESIAGPVGLGMAIGGGISKVAGAVIKLFWGDPFRDRNFKRIAEPLSVQIPALTGSAGASAVDRTASKLVTGELELVEVGDAYQTSLDRAIGADAAHNKLWTVRQLAAASRYAREGITLFTGMSTLRAQFVDALEADGIPSSYTLKPITTATRDASVERAIAAFPKALTALLNKPPLSGLHVLPLFKSAVSTPTAGTFSLASVFDPRSLTADEERVATELQTFVLIVKSLKPGKLPAGI
jgi:hypothetical protein